MAEILGAVTGVMGVAGVALQFAESIKKLHQFCKAVRNAPKDIRDEAEHLQLYSFVLEDLANQLKHSSLPPDLCRSLPLILQACRRGHAEVSTLVMELEARVPTKRGALRAACKQKELRDHLVRIENAKSSLALAQMVHQGVMLRRSHILLEKLASSQMVAAQHTRQEAVCVPGSSSNADTDVCQRPNQQDRSREPSDEVETSTPIPLRTRLNEPIKLVGRLRFQPLPWLTYQTWDFVVHRASKGWNVNFRTYQTVPDNAPLLLACMVGDVRGVQDILARKSASVYDRDPSGFTCLHYLYLGLGMYSDRGYVVSEPDYLRLSRILRNGGGEVSAITDSDLSVLYCSLLANKYSRELDCAPAEEDFRWLVDSTDTTDLDFCTIINFAGNAKPGLIQILQRWTFSS